MAVTTNFGVPVENEGGATLMPKLQYRFRVKFINLGGQSGTKATRNVVSVNKPTLTHEEVIIDTYHSKIYVAGKHAWEAISITLRDDVDSEVVSLLGAQLNQQVNHHDQSAPMAADAYKFGMVIETLDGGRDEGDFNVLDAWEVEGCFLTNVTYGEFNYATSESVIVTATIRFDNASHEIDGHDVLSQIEH
jgi:aromatic ring-cleaving dioxygenase